MAADIINGMEIRESILEELRGEVANLKRDYNVVPGLVTILVGNHPASLSYVTLKIKTAIELGFHEIQDNQSETITEEELIGIIKKYSILYFILAITKASYNTCSSIFNLNHFKLYKHQYI